MNVSKLLLPAVLLLTANAANAAQHMRYGIQTYFGFGGDTFIEGGQTALGTDTLTGGEHDQLGVYLVKPNILFDLSGKLALNAIVAEELYTNGNEDFSTVSLDFLLVKELSNSLYFGAGATYHIDPTYTYNVSSQERDLEYDPALGFIIELTKEFQSGFTVGLSYTNIEYSGIENNYNAFSETVDASSFALTIGLTLY